MAYILLDTDIQTGIAGGCSGEFACCAFIAETCREVKCLLEPVGVDLYHNINLPDMMGIEFASQAKSRFPGIRILAVTSMAQRHIIELAVKAGVMGFVLKTSDVKDITEGIRQVAEGNSYFGQGVKELMPGHSVSGTSEPLITRRESEILKLISEGHTNQEIAEKLFISSSTVDSHRKNLLIKFNAKNTAALIKTAISRGII